jgi:hypothetical protein
MKKVMGMMISVWMIGFIGCTEFREYIDIASNKGISKKSPIPSGPAW